MDHLDHLDLMDQVDQVDQADQVDQVDLMDHLDLNLVAEQDMKTDHILIKIKENHLGKILSSVIIILKLLITFYFKSKGSSFRNS